MQRVFQQAIITLFLILFLSALPIIIEVSEGNITFNMKEMLQLYIDFFQHIFTGGLGTYSIGAQTREISQDIGNNFVTSLIVMLFGVLSGVIFSLIFALFLSRMILTRILNFILNVFAAIPDFIIITFSLLIAIKFYKLTGIRLISLRPDGGVLNMWFPIVLAGIAPGLYLFKIIAVNYYQISGEDYIKTAVSKGLGLNYINFQHVFKNLEPFIIADLTKMISMSIGNLFIIEYLLNVPGITKFIFWSNDMQPIAVGLFSLLLIAFIVYIATRIVFYCFKKGAIYE